MSTATAALPYQWASGAAAQAFMARLPADVPVILCDGSQPAESLAEAAEQRRLGRPFAVGMCFDDPGMTLARRAAGKLLREMHGTERRAAAFAALADGSLIIDGMPMHEHELASTGQLRTIREFLQMGDAVLVRSNSERAWLERCFQIRIRHAMLVALPDPRVPQYTPAADADRICIWAPDMDPNELAIYFHAFADLAGPLLVICNEINPGTRHEFVPVAAAHEVLPRARIVVDTNLSDPGAALAFAQQGVRLCHPLANGAHEYIQSSMPYHPGNSIAIREAVARAGGMAQAYLRGLPSIAHAQAILAQAVPPQAPAGPLVSVIIPTFNRPTYLRRALEDIARQTYKNIEIVVVNDAGQPIDDIIADFPNAVLVSLTENVGPCAAINAGLRAAKGAYLAAIADDDMHYPTHFAYMVHAARESGLAVIHSDVINNLVHLEPDGHVWTTGYHLSHDGDLDPIAVHWSMVITGLSLLIEREAYKKINYWDANWPVVGDFDILLRLARLYDFAHVPVVTGEFRVREDGTTISNQNTERFVIELQSLFERFTLPERPLVAKRQAHALSQAVYKKRNVAAFFPCWQRLGTPRRVN